MSKTIHPLHPHSGLRIFLFSILLTIGTLLWAFTSLGPAGLLAALILIIIEVTFSLDNAIINAKTLVKMSRLWQTLFLTVGILIAIFGVRLILPIVLVMVSANMDFQTVLNAALYDSEKYSHALEEAYPKLAAFGGAFLLMLALHFFLDKERQVHWFKSFEKWAQRYATFWAPALVAIIVITILTFLPFNEHPVETAISGGLGIAAYTVLHFLVRIFESIKNKMTGENKKGAKSMLPQTGVVALTSFIYLEVLDASFSFDSVIGAFAVTTNIVLIALGLGVGAIWVRSLTVYMVRRGTLSQYRYLEHGAHYTIFVLAGVLLFGIFAHVPEAVAGVVSIGMITSAVIASLEANRKDRKNAKKRLPLSKR